MNARPTAELRRRRHAIWLDQAKRCCWCGYHVKFSASTIEHLIPRSRGGSNEWCNLAVACGSCNHSRKDGRYPKRFTRERLAELVVDASQRAAARMSPMRMLGARAPTHEEARP